MPQPWDNKVSDIIQPNSEGEDGEYWDPWVALHLNCCSYNSEIDQNAIDVLRGIRDGLYNSDIAKLTGLTGAHVELLQSIFCSADWCEYGTSPRGCWPIDREGFPALVAAWESYYERHWNEPASVDRSPQGGDRETGRHAKHESAVAKPDAHPSAPFLQTPQGGDS